jgi:hypothetical protein
MFLLFFLITYVNGFDLNIVPIDDKFGFENFWSKHTML